MLDPYSNRLRAISRAGCGFNDSSVQPVIDLSECAMHFYTNRTTEIDFELKVMDADGGGVNLASA